MTAGNENDIILVCRITDDTNTLRLSTKDITLSSNSWDGKSLTKGQNAFAFNEVGKRIDVLNEAVSGEVSTLVFGFIKNTSNSLLDGFIEEFYPGSSGRILTTMKVELGVIWTGATLETEITWLHQYQIDDYQYGQSNINIIASEFSEFEDFEIPFYLIQKDYDNEISYFPGAPDDDYGKVLPIIYGIPCVGETTTRVQLNYSSKSYAPLIIINKSKLEFIGACHKVFSYDASGITIGADTHEYTGQWVFSYNNQINNYIGYLNASTSVSNTEAGLIIDFAGNNDPITRYCQIQMSLMGEGSDTVTDAKEIVDRDETNYLTLNGQDNVILRKNISSIETIFNGYWTGFASTAVQWSSDSANARTAKIRNYRPDTGGTAESSELNSSDTDVRVDYFRDVTEFTKGLADIAITLEVGINNTSADGDYIRVYNIWQEWYLIQG